MILRLALHQNFARKYIADSFNVKHFSISCRLAQNISKQNLLIRADAEGALIDLLVEFELRELDRPFREERSVNGVH